MASCPHPPGSHLFRPAPAAPCIHFALKFVGGRQDETRRPSNISCSASVRACAPGWLPYPPTPRRDSATEKINKRERQKRGRNTDEAKHKKRFVEKYAEWGKAAAPPVSSQRFLGAAAVRRVLRISVCLHDCTRSPPASYSIKDGATSTHTADRMCPTTLYHPFPLPSTPLQTSRKFRGKSDEPDPSRPPPRASSSHLDHRAAALVYINSRETRNSQRSPRGRSQARSTHHSSDSHRGLTASALSPRLHWTHYKPGTYSVDKGPNTRQHFMRQEAIVRPI